MDISRRGFLSLAPAAVIGWSISRAATAESHAAVERLWLVDLLASADTPGVLSLSRNGNELMRAHMAPHCTFRWVAAPGGEIDMAGLTNGSSGITLDSITVRHSNGHHYLVNTDGTFSSAVDAPPLSITFFAR